LLFRMTRWPTCIARRDPLGRKACPLLADIPFRTGQVVPENFHGTWVYLTRQEARLESACWWIAGVAAVIAVAVDAYKDPWHRRERLGR
jgi:hypothetical protein